MKRQRKTASYLIRVWQEPSQWQPPGEWRVSAHPLEGGGEVFFKSAADLWRYLTNEKDDSHVETQSNIPTLEGEEKHEK